MPFNRPTITELAREAENDLASRLGAFGRLRRNVINVLARVWAGLAHGIYAFIQWISRQVLPMTAESQYLDMHGSWWGIRRKGAARANGQAIFTGLVGSNVLVGTILSSQDGGRYLTTVGGQIDDDGEINLPIEAELGGAVYDLGPGVKLSLISPQSGVNSEAEIDADGVIGGAAVETDDQLRERLLARVQEPPQGGTLHDYVAWAKAVPGVTRAWAYGNLLGPGTVGLTFVNDGATDIIPSNVLVNQVQSYLEDPIRKPITADIIVYAPVPQTVDVTIGGLSPDTDKIREAVTAELAALWARETYPGGTLLISHVREVISQAAGENDHTLISPTENIVPNNLTAILILGEVNFVSA
jgi:uncharacterized phage protein gp47/JayE